MLVGAVHACMFCLAHSVPEVHARPWPRTVAFVFQQLTQCSTNDQLWHVCARTHWLGELLCLAHGAALCPYPPIGHSHCHVQSCVHRRSAGQHTRAHKNVAARCLPHLRFPWRFAPKTLTWIPTQRTRCRGRLQCSRQSHWQGQSLGQGRCLPQSRGLPRPALWPAGRGTRGRAGRPLLAACTAPVWPYVGGLMRWY